MNLSEIEKFATRARRNLTEGVDAALVKLGFADKMQEEPVAVQGGWTYRGEIVEDADFGPRWIRLKEFIENEEAKGKNKGRKVAVERAAYTWFNRLVAIRILAKRGLVQPQLEWTDKSAHVPQIVHRMRTGGGIPNLTPGEDAALARVRRDPTKTREQFAILVGAFCRETPILKAAFGEIDDWTMLLVPSNLLAAGGLVDDLNNSALLSDDDYRQDELIGWLYQYYIAERKAEVYDGFKKNKKAGVAEIPAATQIFTPHWIVKYLVENTIKNADESAKFIDPCCGSGHILLEAFRRFVDVYDDLGYSKRDAITQIFERNITGIDIDPRARQLSTFALLLAATKEDELFADAHVLPRVYDTALVVGDNIVENGIAKALDTMNKSAIGEITASLDQLRERGDTIGSLLKLDISPETRALVETRLGDIEDEGLRRALALVLTLTAKYDALVTNPPYLGAGNLEGDLKKYLEENYRDGKSDLFAAFILRLLELCKNGGRVGMITMESWMFLSSYEKLRKQICANYYIHSLGHFGWHIIGIAFGTSMFVIEKAPQNERIGEYSYLTIDDVDQDKNVPYAFPKKDNGRYAIADQRSFAKIPGSPIAYWVGEKMIKAFDGGTLHNVARAAKGLVTAQNNIFVRCWFEVSARKMSISPITREEAKSSGLKWFPYAKGGEFRRWYGNYDSVVNWLNDGYEIQTTLTSDGTRVRATNFNLDRIFKPGVSWTVIGAGLSSFRYVPQGFLFDAAAGICQSKGDCSNEAILACLNTPIAANVLGLINPTINLHPGYLEALPFKVIDGIEGNVASLISLSRSDWDEYETSWDFKVNPLVREGWQRNGSAMSLETAWAAVFARRMEWAARMKALEEENNRLFIKAYGLEDELKPDVEWKAVSITGNPYYRYKVDTPEKWRDSPSPIVPPELEAVARGSAMRELLSYGMGVLMGRYSLEQEGLILASQGETYKDYIERVHGAGKILPDDDGIIPAIALDGSIFQDNLLHRMREFLSAAFGNDALPGNLNFIEEALGCGFDKYLTDKFFDDHAKTYRKRPIYWLFESPKGYFRAFAYMHRMTGATAGLIRNKYLLSYIEHLERTFAAESAKGAAMNGAERRRVKEIEKAIADCKAYDLVLHDIAEKSIAIDLDDGVVANWAKYKSVLARI